MIHFNFNHYDDLSEDDPITIQAISPKETDITINTIDIIDRSINDVEQTRRTITLATELKNLSSAIDLNSICQPGSYKKEGTCFACDTSKGEYQDALEQNSCLVCDDGSIPNTKGTACIRCEAGFFVKNRLTRKNPAQLVISAQSKHF